MFTWLAANAGTIVVFLILCGIVTAAAYSIIRDRRCGKTSCGSTCGGCAGCAACGHCASHGAHGTHHPAAHIPARKKTSAVRS